MVDFHFIARPGHLELKPSAPRASVLIQRWEETQSNAVGFVIALITAGIVTLIWFLID
jgi:hypothetical protein